MPYLEYTEPNVCIDENLVTDDAGALRLQPWSVPRLVADVRAVASGEGAVYPTTALPGKLLINQQVSWRNDSPLEQMVLIRVTRASRAIVVSNPNAIQFRDRWTYAVDTTPSPPVTTGLFNGQSGASLDLNTNSVAEPNPGVWWSWTPTVSADEWWGPLKPSERFNLWYRAYVWTPPPWSDNANKNQPIHNARASWSRIQLWAYPDQGKLMSG